MTDDHEIVAFAPSSGLRWRLVCGVARVLRVRIVDPTTLDAWKWSWTECQRERQDLKQRARLEPPPLPPAQPTHVPPAPRVAGEEDPVEPDPREDPAAQGHSPNPAAYSASPAHPPGPGR